MTTFLIISFIAFHLPSAFLKDTYSRYEKMKMYNPKKALEYDINNGWIFNERLKKNDIIIIIGFLSGLIFSSFPLFMLFDFNWFLLIIGNFIFYGISPFIGSFLTPTMGIHTRKSLMLMSILFVIIGFISLFIGYQY